MLFKLSREFICFIHAKIPDQNKKKILEDMDWEDWNNIWIYAELTGEVGFAQQGVTYFAFNGKVAQCKNYHSFYGKVCPVCGEPVAVEYTRIVGFYTPTKTYSKERKAEFKLREWMPLNEKGANA